MPDPYSARQARLDSQYSREYAAWLASLSPEEMREVRRMGLDAPMLARHGTGAPERDIADSPAASYTPDIPAQADRRASRPTHSDPSADAMSQATRILRHFVADVICDANARLTVECLAVAIGLSAYDGESMSSIARRHDITRAAVSKRCVDITKRLGLPPSRAMRTVKARAIYSQSQINKSKSYDATESDNYC